MATPRFETNRAAAAQAGVTPATIRAWRVKGWLGEPPWTSRQLDKAAQAGRQRGGRGPVAPHGTTDRWRAGCNCDACLAAHNQAETARHAKARRAYWADGRAAAFVAAIAAGRAYRDALDQVGVTAQAVTAHRHRDAEFAAALDQALMDTRNPDLPHGTPTAWKAECRCPECRQNHAAS